MDKLRQFFSTSEGWAVLVSAILGVLVTAGVITPEMAKVATEIIVALLAIAFTRIAKKTVSPGEVPFVPSGGAK